MGFFSDLKEDLSLAVNELMPEEALRVPIPEQETLAEAESEAKNKAENQIETEAVVKTGAEALTEDIKPVAEEQKLAKQEMQKQEGQVENIIPEEISVIAAGMTIAGDITSQGSVVLMGCVNGNIDIQDKLNIIGHITGNSKAPEIVVSKAMVNGELVSTGTVHIETGSVVIGNIIATGAVIAGAVKGDIDVKGAVVLESSAIVKGNIKSKSVQMNNGAVIEGICSQCYADVSPTAFFDDYRPEIKK